MTEISDLSDTDATNTAIGGESLGGNIANMGRMDNTLQVVMGMLSRWRNSGLFRLRDSTDKTKLLALDLSGLTTATTRTLTVQDKDGTIALVADTALKIDTRRNMSVNGSFVDDQEHTGTLGTTNGYYPADQTALYFVAATGAMSVQQIAARTLANALNQIEYKCTTAKASLGASDFVTLTQNIEGSSIAAAGWGTGAAKPIVMRFQITAPAGLYHVHVANSANNRHCSIPFTATGTAQIVTVTIPGDTSGTWLTADGVIGATVELVLAAGATLTGGSPSTWGGTAYLAASTQFNSLSSTANVVRLADVGLKLDPDATGVYGAYRAGEVDAKFSPARYYTKNLQITLRGNAAGAGGVIATSVLFPTEMCKAPGVVGISVTATANVSVEAYEVITATGYRLRLTSAAGGDTFTLERLVQHNARLS